MKGLGISHLQLNAWANWAGIHSTNIQKYTFKMPLSNVTDTANATPITYKIVYDLGGGSLSKENPKTYTVETETFTLNNPTKTGYTFLGWADSNGTTPNKNFSVPKGNIEDKTYIANWQVNQYPVAYIDVDSNGNADYTVSVNGTFCYNDTLKVIPESSLILTDRSKISSMQADVLQQKTTFTKEDGVANGTTATGSISADRKLFAGSWSGNFNFN